MNNLMVTGTYRIILYINQHFLLKFLYLYMYMNSTAVKKRYCRVNKHLIILIIVLTHLGRLKTKHASNCHHLITICCILATRQFQPNVIHIFQRRRDRMVVEFTTTCAIVAYHHKSCEFEPCSRYNIM
jgi:hypothetical protein